MVLQDRFEIQQLKVFCFGFVRHDGWFYGRGRRRCSGQVSSIGFLIFFQEMVGGILQLGLEFQFTKGLEFEEIFFEQVVVGSDQLCFQLFDLPVKKLSVGTAGGSDFQVFLKIFVAVLMAFFQQ